MNNSQALETIHNLVGLFKGMPLKNIQLANNPLVNGKPFEPPKALWAKVTVKNAGSHIAEIGNKPLKRTSGIIFIQLFAPMNTGTLELSKLADQWAEHLQFKHINTLEIRAASIVDVGENNDFYQYNVNVSYVIN